MYFRQQDMRPREGDLLENTNRVIFDVKGFLHPPDKIIAFPRFVPTGNGDRKRGNLTYKKIYNIAERYRFLTTHFPHYLVYDKVLGLPLCEVPINDVRRHLEPVRRLRTLRKKSPNDLSALASRALSMLTLLKTTSNVPWNALGISGSLLAQLAHTDSDIDPIVSGQKNSLEVYKAMKSLLKDKRNTISHYNRIELAKLYRFRSQDTKMSFEDFLEVERRKVLQGRFLQSDFYIRCIKDWNEIGEQYGDIIYRSVGYARIKAVIKDDSDAIFTPCRYLLEQVRFLRGKRVKEISEIVSFRGRFCEQAKKGETVLAQGKIEQASGRDGCASFRLLLGAKTSDFMVKRRVVT
jgi:predicted nucleotidyltransferase